MRMTPYLKESLKNILKKEMKLMLENVIKYSLLFITMYFLLKVFLGIDENAGYLNIVIAYMINIAIIAAIWCLFLFLVKLGASVIRIMLENKELDDDSIEINDEMYREILRGYSPAVLSYLDDYNVEIEKDILATLLILQIKKKIEIRNGEIKIIDKNEDGLLRTEKTILKGIYNGSSYEEIKKMFNYDMQHDLRDLNLIEKNAIGFKFKKIAIFGLIIIGLLFLMDDGGHIELEGNVSLLLLVAFIIFGEMSSTTDKNKLNEKGKDVKRKLRGLREYLKEYSNMENKTINEIGLWDEYYICSVILGDNKIALSELRKLQYNHKRIFKK